MKATFRIVVPAAASAVAVVLLSACADKPVHLPGGAFVEEPYTGETITRTQTITSNGSETIEAEVIYFENDVPVGPVGNGEQQGGVSEQEEIIVIQPIEQQPETKSNVPEGSVEYKVVKGDTLWGIGMVYGVSVARLAEINGLDEKAPLKIGQVIMIPPDAKNAVGKPIPKKKTDTKPAATSSTSTKTSASSATKAAAASTAKPVAKDGEILYVVKKGDSLSVIAQRHHVKLADLVAANKIDQHAILRIGQTLVIPAAGSKAAAATTTTKSSGTATTTKTADSNTKSDATTSQTASTTKSNSGTASSQQKGGEGTGGVVEPIGGSSSGVSATSTQASSAQAGSGSSAPSLDPVSALPDTDIISIPIDSESTLEEVANIHDRNLEDLIRLNPEFKPGQKIPAGTAIKMPLF